MFRVHTWLILIKYVLTQISGRRLIFRPLVWHRRMPTPTDIIIALSKLTFYFYIFLGIKAIIGHMDTLRQAIIKAIITIITTSSIITAPILIAARTMDMGVLARVQPLP